MSRSLSRIVMITAVVLAPSLASGGEREYTFYDIFNPACPSDPRTYVHEVNDSGVVVGYYAGDPCFLHGFRWVNGVMTDLHPTYEDGFFNSAHSIGRTGTILGAGAPDDVLVLEDGDDSVQVMPTPFGCVEQSYANRINDAGTMIAGECSTDGGGIFVPAVYWIGSELALALPLLPGMPDDADGEARDVNDDGVVIVLFGGEIRSYSWIGNGLGGEITEIPNLIGGTGVAVSGINNHNLIVGEAEIADGTLPAMSYDLNTGEMTVLGPGRAEDVNDRGSAVGRVILDFTDVHAMLYEGGEAIDLSPFFPPELADAARSGAINSYGWIVGWADDPEGVPHGWLLVPVYDKGDYDGDGDVDLQDSGHFQRCFAAEPYIDGTLHVGCSVFDFDDDVDLDLDDYAAFQSAFTGPTAPNRNPNGPG